MGPGPSKWYTFHSKGNKPGCQMVSNVTSFILLKKGKKHRENLLKVNYGGQIQDNFE